MISFLIYQIKASATMPHLWSPLFQKKNGLVFKKRNKALRIQRIGLRFSVKRLSQYIGVSYG